MTEMEKTKSAGRVLYDGQCRLCLTLVWNCGAFLERQSYEVGTLQDAGFPLDEMRVVCPDGRVYGGADAVLRIVSRTWRGRVLSVLARIPGTLALARRAYRFVAARRSCAGGACAR